MLDQLSVTTFAEQLNTTFRVIAETGHLVELELIVAEDRGSNALQERFVLLFRGPLQSFLPQRIYRMEHDQLGAVDLFIVPVAQQADGFRYEAVFNRLLSPEA